MISTKGRYALRIMIDLASQDNESFIPLKDIAERQNQLAVRKASLKQQEDTAKAVADAAYFARNSWYLGYPRERIVLIVPFDLSSHTNIDVNTEVIIVMLDIAMVNETIRYAVMAKIVSRSSLRMEIVIRNSPYITIIRRIPMQM